MEKSRVISIKDYSRSLLYITIVLMFVASLVISYFLYREKVKEVRKARVAVLALIEQNVRPALKLGLDIDIRNYCKKIVELEALSFVQILGVGGSVICNSGVQMSGDPEEVTSDLYFDNQRKNILGKLIVHFQKPSLFFILPSFLSFFVLSFVAFYFSFRKSYKIIGKPLFMLNNALNKAMKTGVFYVNQAFELKELNNLNRNIQNLLDASNELAETKKTIDVLSFRNDIAKQVAHDIKSPLSALEMLLKDSSIQQSSVKEILEATVKRMKGITDNLRNFGKGKYFKKEMIVVKDLVGSITRLVKEKSLEYSGNENVSIEFSVPDELPCRSVNINLNDLERVLSNLINNSFQALEEKEGGRILIRLSYKVKKLIIDVLDNGKGVPEDLLHKVFEKGFSYDKLNGDGIGLSHAKSIMKELGGDITFDSEEGSGSCMSVQLPMVK